MARSRNIKPGFFTNERLAECDPLARLLFAGLWCFADREGRLECRPKRIKAEILPYDRCNIDKLLGQLEAGGFIQRYGIGQAEYITIPNFTRHQNPHVREPASTLPAPGQHRASTGPAAAKPEPAGPLTDSLNPLTDSLSPPSEAPSALATKGPLDLKRELWTVGKLFLGKQGIAKARAGELLGLWRRGHSDEVVLAALAAAEAECASDVVGFVEGFLRSRNGTGKRHGPATGIAQGFADALRAGEGEPDEDRRPH